MFSLYLLFNFHEFNIKYVFPNVNVILISCLCVNASYEFGNEHVILKLYYKNQIYILKTNTVIITFGFFKNIEIDVFSPCTYGQICISNITCVFV